MQVFTADRRHWSVLKVMWKSLPLSKHWCNRTLVRTIPWWGRVWLSDFPYLVPNSSHNPSTIDYSWLKGVRDLLMQEYILGDRNVSSRSVRHIVDLLMLSCRESAVREETPGTANLADAKSFAPKNGWGPAKVHPCRNGFFPINWQWVLGCG